MKEEKIQVQKGKWQTPELKKIGLDKTESGAAAYTYEAGGWYHPS